MKISSKLFAHIHNDAHLVGTRTLEGLDFNQTIDYLFQYVNTYNADQDNTDNTLIKKSIAPLLKKLEYLKKNGITQTTLQQKTRGLTLKELNELPEFNLSTTKIYEQIKSQPNTLIQGGWQNTDGGHAMVYEFRKDVNNDLIFIIHNSGAGLNYHQTIQDLDKERFCPIKAYRIPQAELKEDRLNWFVGELIKPRLLLKNEGDYSAKRLYEEVFPKIAYLNGQLEDSFQYTRQDNLTAGQHSGTCTEKSLHQMVEHALPDKKTYKQFIYGLKRYSLEEYIKQVKNEDSIDKPGVRNQVSLAIENMSRLLLKSDYFDNEKRKNEAGFLLEKQKEFSRTLIEPEPIFNINKIKTDLDKLEEKDQKTKLTDLDYPKATKKPELKKEELNKVKSVPKDNINFDFNTKNITSDLDDFYKEINTLSETDPKAAIDSLEQFFIHFPIPVQTEHQKIKKNLTKLEKLNLLYTKIYKTLNAEVITPKFTVSQLSFIGIITSLDEQDKFLEIVQSAIHYNLVTERANPYFGSEDFQYDARYTHYTSRCEFCRI